uniref:Catalytic n=1 Tax=Rhizophora mucronata TaxID=61149 RepID=A0A2P2KJE3_RHIMU
MEKVHLLNLLKQRI